MSTTLTKIEKAVKSRNRSAIVEIGTNSLQKEKLRMSEQPGRIKVADVANVFVS